MLVVMRLNGWSFARAVRFVGDSLVLRQFCRLYRERPPHPATLIRWAGLIGPDTLQRLNDRAVQLARSRKVTRGRKLRVDTTAVATDVRRPCDSGLLCDGIRVVSRLLRRARMVVPALGRGAFRGRSRTARRLARRLRGLARRARHDRGAELRAIYARLIAAARCMADQATRVLDALRAAARPVARRVAAKLEVVLPRLGQVVRQAYRRVINGESVPARDKLLSLFEPHTQIVPRHKAGQAVEFGRKVRLDEVEGGIVTGYRVVDRGGGQDYAYLADSLVGHLRLFGRPPDLLAADRGLSSVANERLAYEAGVRRVALPRSGRLSDERRRVEASRAFKRAYRFRAGIEGRIHVLRRDYGLRRCRYRGESGMGRWVGWGVVTNNLARIAAAVAARQA